MAIHLAYVTSAALEMLRDVYTLDIHVGKGLSYHSNLTQLYASFEESVPGRVASAIVGKPCCTFIIQPLSRRSSRLYLGCYYAITMQYAA